MVIRTAFTMIELLFAIVIIAFSVLAIPMISQVTSKGVESTIEAQEAIFKAVVMTKYETMKNYNFDNLENAKQATLTPIQTAAGSLEGYKFQHSYTLGVDSSSTFGEDTVSNNDIKKVTTVIYDENNKKLVQLIAYKFNR